MVLLTSSGADELSQESRALAGSVFTHHLVSGLRGAADDERATARSRVGRGLSLRVHAHARGYRDERRAAAAGVPLRAERARASSCSRSSRRAKTRADDAAEGRRDASTSCSTQHEWRLIAEARGREGSRRRARARARQLPRQEGARAIGSRSAASCSPPARRRSSTASRTRARRCRRASSRAARDDLAPEERRDWQRTQAFGLLAARPGAAPRSRSSMRCCARHPTTCSRGAAARARSCGIAEAYQRVNDTRARAR